MRIGIPRSLFYHYDGNMWKYFFKNLKVDYIISKPTTKETMELGTKYASDEMCLAFKNYLGHVASLQTECDMVLVPRIDNYGLSNQTCTNFLAAFDIVHNLFPKPVLNYNICETNGQKEEQAYIHLGAQLGYPKEECLIAYHNALTSTIYEREQKIVKNLEKLNSSNPKVLILGHPYNLQDEFIGKPVLSFLKENDIEVIDAYYFHQNITNLLSEKLSSTLYFKYSRDLIGSIPLVYDQVDGFIFVSAFPCGPDSLVNELVLKKLKKPSLNLVLDDLDSFVGIETRLESFIDILKEEQK